jgi:hypothetical protein
MFPSRLSFFLFLVSTLSAQSAPPTPLIQNEEYETTVPSEFVSRTYDSTSYDRKDLDNNDDIQKIALGYWPHPYAAVEASAMPAGYAPLAYYMELGFNLESKPGIAHFYFGYDNGHKTDDGDQPNPHGHDRSLHGEIYGRLSAIKRPRWFVGGGYGWSQLSTTNYAKGGTRPYFGGRYDMFWDHAGSHSDCGGCWFSARLGVDYFTAGSDWENGSHGVSFSMVMPRPIEKRHMFLMFTTDIFRFHETVTEPYNAPLTTQQLGQGYFTGDASMGVLYRFW